MAKKQKVYLDAGSLQQFQRVVDEYRAQEGGDDLEYIYLTSADQITERNPQVWLCSEMHRNMSSMYEARYYEM